MPSRPRGIEAMNHIPATPPPAEPVALAQALLRACPVPASALRMWHAAMPIARERWGWAPLLEALIAAAEANERAAPAWPGQRP